MKISVESRGSFKKTDDYLRRMLKLDILSVLATNGEKGVNALSNATPRDSGLTADSWTYEVDKTSTSYRITWKNTNVNDGSPIAILLQYGHGTGTGGYVAGQDYINPAIRPVFDQIADDVWKAVKTA